MGLAMSSKVAWTVVEYARRLDRAAQWAAHA